MVRPTVGCRSYLTRVVYKLLPALENDMSDWLVETRVKASALLHVLMTHMEETPVAAQHADKVLNLMLSGARDDEVRVVKNVCRVAEAYGAFVPPKTWLSLACPKVLAADPRASATDLMVVSLVVQASDKELFAHVAEDLVLTLQDDTVCLRIDVSRI